MAIEIKGSDVRANTLVNPGWYIIEVKGMTIKAAKTDGSNNFNYDVKILSDLKGDTEFEDARVKPILVNEKGIFGSSLNFFGACDPQVKAAMDAMKKDKNALPVRIDENAPVGVKMKAKIEITEFDSRKSNECKDFLPLS